MKGWGMCQQAAHEAGKLRNSLTVFSSMQSRRWGSGQNPFRGAPCSMQDMTQISSQHDICVVCCAAPTPCSVTPCGAAHTLMRSDCTSPQYRSPNQSIKTGNRAAFPWNKLLQYYSLTFNQHEGYDTFCPIFFLEESAWCYLVLFYLSALSCWGDVVGWCTRRLKGILGNILQLDDAFFAFLCSMMESALGW